MLLQLYGNVSCIGKAGDMQAVMVCPCNILPPFGSCMPADWYSTCWSVCVATAASLDSGMLRAGAQKRSFLLVLDASNMQEVARAWTSHPVTLGFHGNFFGLDAFKAGA